MNEVKSVIQSRAVWAGLVGFVAWTFKLQDLDQGSLVDGILQVVTGGSLILGVAFRILAKKRIG